MSNRILEFQFDTFSLRAKLLYSGVKSYVCINCAFLPPLNLKLNSRRTYLFFLRVTKLRTIVLKLMTFVFSICIVMSCTAHIIEASLIHTYSQNLKAISPF